MGRLIEDVIARARTTDDATWLLAPGWDGVPKLDLPALLRRCPRVVAVVARPGDEMAALGATLADLAALGTTITVVLAADRAAADRDAITGATTALGEHVSALWCDLPDDAPEQARNDIGTYLSQIVDARTAVFSPAECDGGPEHAVVALAAQEAVRRASAVLLEYPIMLWQCATPSDVDWSRLRTLSPSLAGLQARARAIQRHALPLRTFETVLIPTAADLAARVRDAIIADDRRGQVAGQFDALLGDIDDPWRLDDFVYDRRRVALVLACLGRERYHRILEIGCGTGQLAEELTGRADQVVALDASPRALEIARRRTDAVGWVQGVAPAELPDETFDAIILSEVGYHLDGPDLTATLRFARRHLSAHGEVVLAHRRELTSTTPLDGSAVHEQAAAVLDLPLRARYEDADIVVEAWGEPISVHREYRGTS
ncbi:methyltransferase domain-containing protein [Mycobacterium sp. NPDC003323]